MHTLPRGLTRDRCIEVVCNTWCSLAGRLMLYKNKGKLLENLTTSIGIYLLSWVKHFRFSRFSASFLQWEDKTFVRHHRKTIKMRAVNKENCQEREGRKIDMMRRKRLNRNSKWSRIENKNSWDLSRFCFNS